MHSSIFVVFAVLIGLTAAFPHGGNSRGTEEEENNKRIVLTFYQELFGDIDLTAIERYISADEYIQHNPLVADGRDAFKAAATQWLEGAEPTTVDIRRVAANGDLVWLHVKVYEQAVVDIFRLKNGLLVEHWDVIQDIPETSANPHPMF